MSTWVIVKEIALWALTHRMDDIGDHLDLSDYELAKVLAWLQVDLADRLVSENGGGGR